MKIELEPYDYCYEPSGQQAMMVANGHNGMHASYPFNLEDNFLHILGKTHSIKIHSFNGIYHEIFRCGRKWLRRQII